MSPDTPCILYLGTDDGLLVARLRNQEIEIVNWVAQGNAVRDISVHNDNVFDVYVGCGLRGWGLYHADDIREGAELVGFEDQWIWGVTRHPQDPDQVYVGTEPPMLYISQDDTSSFESFEQIEELSSRPNWKFFHEPFYDGHIHGIAIHPDRPERIFAGVEHGAFIYSHDGGDTWQESLIGADVHRVAVNPSNADHIFAATGSGLYQSFDGGEEWEQTSDLHGFYLHGILFRRESPETMYVYADKTSPLYKSTDGGRSWSPLSDEIPSSGPADVLRQHPDDPDTLIYVGDTADQTSKLFVSHDAGDSWNTTNTIVPKTWRLEVVSDEE